jgi:hypothetical protein
VYGASNEAAITLKWFGQRQTAFDQVAFDQTTNTQSNPSNLCLQSTTATWGHEHNREDVDEDLAT